MAKTVADQMVKTLAAANVRRIYGIVGDSLNATSRCSRLPMRLRRTRRDCSCLPRR